MDLAPTLEPNSDQLDAVDLATAGPRIFTITKVTKGNAEQPANIHLAEFPRVWRPGKNMRRVLAGCWGKETDAWPTGGQVELYCDETVVFAGVAVGGIRISRVSHIDGQKKIPLILTKGKSVVWKVDPLPNAAGEAVAVGAAVSEETLVELNDLFVRKGIPKEARLAGANTVTGGSATALECITEDEARRVLAALDQRPDLGASA